MAYETIRAGSTGGFQRCRSREYERTCFADGLFAAWQPESVDCQFAAVGASQFVWDIVGSQGAVTGQYPPSQRGWDRE